MTQPAIAAAVGVLLSTVNRAHMAYDREGIEALKPKPIGGRQRENMTCLKKSALLARFVRLAGTGEMLNIHDLKAACERAIGHPTSNSTVYNLLAGMAGARRCRVHFILDVTSRPRMIFKKRAASHVP
jgi:transposase